MFVDTATVNVAAGKGGDGAVSFRHEIYVDKGGPDGGDGGKGGDVVFRASENVNTLLDFRYKPELKAKDGGAGAKRDRHGRNGEDLIVKVPVGTVVTRDGVEIADLAEHDQEVVIAQGGDGGFGNAHFKSSTRQTPRMAEKGEPGDAFEAVLELKLLADVGLVGFPNAGKSTFLSVISNARPEVADYAFTTLTPHLGVADIDNDSLLVADIPGLIEGASEGKGLGDDFLRHVERTGVLLHLIDVYSDDIAMSYQTIRNELASYGDKLSAKAEVVALTKCEGLDEELRTMQIDALRSVTPKDTQIFTISSQAHQGMREVLRALKEKVALFREAEAARLAEADVVSGDIPRITLSDAQIAESWSVSREEDEDGTTVFRVRGDKIEKFARRTDFANYEGVNRLRDIMKKMGIAHELSRAGAVGDSVIRIGSSEFTLVEQ